MLNAEANKEKSQFELLLTHNDETNQGQGGRSLVRAELMCLCMSVFM